MAQKVFKPGRGYTQADWEAVDSPPLTKEEIASLRPAKEVLPVEFFEAVKEARKKLGRPRKTDKLVAVTVRLPPDVLDRWKAKGNDWRTRMAERLKG
jgi:uncharacterized protein (DUF4415 family)